MVISTHNLEIVSDMFDFLSVGEVVEKTGLSRTTIWRMRRVGSFPHPVRISQGRIGFRLSDLEAWNASLGGAV